jgi:hypothetical protein
VTIPFANEDYSRINATAVTPVGMGFASINAGNWTIWEKNDGRGTKEAGIYKESVDKGTGISGWDFPAAVSCGARGDH